MNGLLLIFYAISISVSCLTLGLSIGNRIFHGARWCRWYIVFQACIFATVLLGFFNLVSQSFFGEKLMTVFDYIFRIMQHSTIAFIVVLLPYFLKWLLGKEWHTSQRVAFFTFGICYFASGLVAVLVRDNVYAQMIQTPVFILVCCYCIFVLGKNLGMIQDKHSRSTCAAIVIVTICLIPVGVLSLIFVYVEAFSYPTYVLAISIITMVYFFNRFSVDSSRLHKKISVSEDDLNKFKITDRELAVVQQVCNGLTNKEIAAKLNISVNTVNNHLANIFEKTGVRSRVDLMRMLKIGLWD